MWMVESIEGNTKGLCRALNKQGCPGPGVCWLTDRRPVDYLCVHGKWSGVAVAKALGPSISVMVVVVVVGCMVCVTYKTNGQEVQPEKQQYLQNIYIQKNTRTPSIFLVWFQQN